ncbi:MAG: hypothetical protein COB67_10470 [SAR324 cluster bacterium]|uniref:Uncharacterized protein n=1 Tax=SAR324 cluster bacterium TaxID=2024889 RepID=A0A2A4SX60_9DELT|nr:MAG: hypothetical protein COB67_10470 [SAR324 cluster bacterium]
MSEHTFHLLLSSNTISVKYRLEVKYSSTQKDFINNVILLQWTRELHVKDLHEKALDKATNAYERKDYDATIKYLIKKNHQVKLP